MLTLIHRSSWVTDCIGRNVSMVAEHRSAGRSPRYKTECYLFVLWRVDMELDEDSWIVEKPLYFDETPLVMFQRYGAPRVDLTISAQPR